MTQTPTLKTVNPDHPLTPEAKQTIADLASRQKRAGGLLMKAINAVGGSVEGALKTVPKGLRDQIDTGARAALRHSYDLAQTSRSGFGARVAGDRTHKALGAMSGVFGGLGGLPSALAELPVATTLIFRAVQGVAATYGEDPTSAETRIECLRVFGAGGPGDASDDGIDTAFIGARLTLTGAAVNKMIARVAPRFAAVLGQKLAAQAVPLIGAATGAGINYAFVSYYTEMAHVHFGLRALAREHEPGDVSDAFHTALAAGKIPRPRP